LLRYLPCPKHRVNQRLCLLSDLCCPSEKSRRIPFTHESVLRRHMLIVGGILICAAIALMGGNPPVVAI